VVAAAALPAVLAGRVRPPRAPSRGGRTPTSRRARRTASGRGA
jgi:hypothetical protein